MSLRKKIISVVFGTMLGIGMLLTLLLSGFSIRNYRTLENSDVNRQVVRAMNNLKVSLDHISSTAGDWAPWDETYNFIKDKNPQYVRNNLTEGALANLDLSLVALIDPTGKTVWSLAFDLAQKRLASPLEDFGTFSANDALLRHQDIYSGASGIMKLSENRLMLVASRPITNSDFSAPMIGSLVMGRMLDSYEIGLLSTQTEQDISIVRMDDPAIPLDMSAAISKIGGPDSMFVSPIDAKRVAGYSLIRDIYGQPAAVLRVIESRGIYEQGRASIGYIVFALFITVMVSVIAVTIILDRLVLKRLTLMNGDITRIDPDSRDRVRVIGDDELSALADTINVAFGKLEKAEAELRASLSEKETLLHEIHHRVKNNLQVVSSLLSLQSDVTREQKVQDALRDSQSRIDSMALVHELLYRPREGRTPDLARIDFRHYLRQLVRHLGQTYGADTSRITIEVEGDELFLDTDSAITCGLIVTELVSNSVKYAFPENSAGTILVAIRTDEAGKVVLVESDDGIGFPPGLGLGQADSMGWLLVPTLVSQLKGRFEIQSPAADNRGSAVRIIFPS